MASLKIRRKKKYSRRTHKERRNNTKKRYRRKNKTRKVKRIKYKMKGRGKLNWVEKDSGENHNFTFTYNDKSVDNDIDADLGKNLIDTYGKDFGAEAKGSDGIEITDQDFRFEKDSHIAQKLQQQQILEQQQILQQQQQAAQKQQQASSSSSGNFGVALSRSPSLNTTAAATAEGILAYLETVKQKSKVVMIDDFYSVEIITNNKNKPEIKIIDKQSNYEEPEGSPYKKYLSNRKLILLENLVDIIHDVVAEGNLSYNGLLSIDLIVKSYTKLYGYEEEDGWELLNKESRIATWLEANSIAGNEANQQEINFKNWYADNVDSNSKSFGVERERAYKRCLYRWMKSKYIMNPKYTSEGVNAEILTDWLYANTSDRLVDVQPYGGGSIRNGIKLWEYILGRGNSFLESISINPEEQDGFKYSWVEESIKIPDSKEVSDHRVTLKDILNFDSDWKKFEEENRVDLDDDDLDNDEEQPNETQIKEREEKKRQKILHIYTHYSFYAYAFISYHSASKSTSLRELYSIKNVIYENYKKLFVFKRNNRLFNFGESLIHPLHINFTDATSKASSAVPKLYELMKLRGQLYTDNDSLPYECRGIGQVCDMATGRVGEPVPLGARKPVCRVEGNHIFDQALLYPIEVHQRHEKTGEEFSELVIRQEVLSKENVSENIEFLRDFNKIYSHLLNDVRMLYKDYIATGFLRKITTTTTLDDIKNSEITTKDLVKLKFFHLMNYFVFIKGQQDQPELKALKNLEKKLKEKSKLMGTKSDFSETECGKALQSAMYTSYLKDFFNPNKTDSYKISDHWQNWGDGTKSKFYKDLTPGSDDDEFRLVKDQNKEQRKKDAVETVRMSPFFRTSKQHLATERLIDFADRSRKTPYSASQRTSTIEAVSFTNRGSPDPLNSNKQRKIYYDKIKKAPSQEVFLKEFFSTAYNFKNLDNAINTYIGWKNRNFTTCDCAEEKLVDLSDDDFSNSIFKIKGVCLKTKTLTETRNLEVGYTKGGKDGEFISLMPKMVTKTVKNEDDTETTIQELEWVYDSFRLIVLPNGKNKYSVRWDLTIPMTDEEQQQGQKQPGQKQQGQKEQGVGAINYKRFTPFLYTRSSKNGKYNKPKALSGNESLVKRTIIMLFKKCVNIIPRNDPGSTKEPDIRPLDLASIYRFLRKTPSQETGTNEDFSPLIQRTTWPESGRYDATTEVHDFWSKIGDRKKDNDIIRAINEIFNTDIPNVSRLLYNCLLFDFETADTITSVIYAGSRTTGRIRTDKFSSFRTGKTFIQKTINTAMEDLQDLENKVNGLQTVTYQKVTKDDAGIETVNPQSVISYSSTNPSVTGVLSSVRQYIVYYLLKNSLLRKAVSKNLNKKEGKGQIMKTAEEFFDMGARSEKESEIIQQLNDSLLDEFIKNASTGQKESAGAEPEFLKFIPQEIRDLPTNSDKRFIVVGVLLNQKTQGDEMQLHGAKAYKNLFPVDDNGLEVLYHVYSYDGVMGIKALRKGVSLLFQSDRGIQISLESKTAEPPGYTRLIKSGIDPLALDNNEEVMSCVDETGFENIDIKSPSDTMETDLVKIKDFTSQNFSVLFDDLSVSSCSDLTATQLKVNDIYGRLIDTHKKAIQCYRRILFNVKNKNEEESDARKNGYKKLDKFFEIIDNLFKNQEEQPDKVLYDILMGNANITLDKTQYKIRDFLEANYEIEIGNDEGQISLDHILENSNDLIKTLDYFQKNLNELESKMALDELEKEKIDFYDANKKYENLFRLIKYFFGLLSNDSTDPNLIPYYLIVIKILFKYVLVRITNEKDMKKFQTPQIDRTLFPANIARAYSIPTAQIEQLEKIGKELREAEAQEQGQAQGQADGASGKPKQQLDDDERNQQLLLEQLKKEQEEEKIRRKLIEASSGSNVPGSPQALSTSPGRIDRGDISAKKRARVLSVSQDGNTIILVDFDEYLKLRLGKIKNVANYVSSEAQNLDNTRSIIESSFALPGKIFQLEETQIKLNREKTSKEAQMGIAEFNEQYEKNKKNFIQLNEELTQQIKKISTPMDLDQSDEPSKTSEEEDIDMQAVEVVQAALDAAGSEMAQLQEKRRTLKRRREEESSGESNNIPKEEQEIDKQIRKLTVELKGLEEQRQSALRREDGKGRRTDAQQDVTKRELDAALLKIKELEQKIKDLEGGKKDE